MNVKKMFNRMLIVLTFLALCGSFAFSNVGGSGGYDGQRASGSESVANLAAAPIAPDGNITPNEWDGARSEWIIIGGDVNITIWFLYDTDYLYFRVDNPDEEPLEREQVFIALDLGHDRSTMPDTNDYKFELKRYDHLVVNQGDNERWRPVNNFTKVGVYVRSPGNSVAELAIPWQDLNFTPEADMIIGFFTKVPNAGSGWGGFPAHSDIDKPSTWANLTLKAEGPEEDDGEDSSETPGFEVITLLISISAVVIVLRYKRRVR
jgi:hypothetical protein